MKYAWAPGATFRGDASEVAFELARIARSGKLTPETVVACAKSRRSVLYPLIFDGTTADEALIKYQLDRARRLIKAVIVVREEAPETLVLRGFYRVVEPGGEREWRPVGEVAGDPEASAQVRKRLIAKMRGLKNELEEFDAYPGVVLALAEALAA